MTFQAFAITRVEKHDPEKLVENLRKVSMLKRPDVFPYAEAEISLELASFSDVLPAQRYVLSDALRRVQHLEWELGRFNINLFALEGYVTIWTDMSPEPIDVLPPIVESSTEANGQPVNIINDGMHRMYAARLEWKKPQVARIKGVPAEYPYYAYPIPGENCWDVVEILEGSHIHSGLIKKWHRISDNKTLYRNFNSSFINVGGPRGQG